MNQPVPRFFSSTQLFRAWLAKYADRHDELLVGFWYKDSGKGGITYAEALDEALCVGWIDGVRRKLDDSSYSIRFTPRRKGSIWSLVNVRHIERLIVAGRMTGAGLAVFAARTPDKTGIYSFEKAPQVFDPALERKFRAARKACKFWEAQPPGYRRVATHWVMSAKREETRIRRLAILIEDSAAGHRLAVVTGQSRKPKTG